MLETSETSEYFLRLFFFRVFDFEYWTKIAKSESKKSEKNSEVSDVSDDSGFSIWSPVRYTEGFRRV